MNWEDFCVALLYGLPFFSATFLLMGVAKYFRNQMADAAKRMVRQSLIAYALHWIVLSARFVTEPKTDFIAVDISLEITLLIALLMLFGSTYFGIRSRQAAG